MNEARLQLSFPEESVAEQSRLASSLHELLQGLSQIDEVELQRENPDSQDAGTILSLVLSAPALTLAIRAIASWAVRNNQARVDIRTHDGTIVVEGLTSDDVPKTIEALHGILRTP